MFIPDHVKPDANGETGSTKVKEDEGCGDKVDQGPKSPFLSHDAPKSPVATLAGSPAPGSGEISNEPEGSYQISTRPPYNSCMPNINIVDVYVLRCYIFIRYFN